LTESVEVGQEDFVRRIGQVLGGKARCRNIHKAASGLKLGDDEATYNAHFEVENWVIGGQDCRFRRPGETDSMK